MGTPLTSSTLPVSARAAFGVTPWTDIGLAGEKSTAAEEALARLCQRYYYPVFSHIRQRVAVLAEAEDLTQEFFVLVVQRNFLGAADRRRGRFRCFLQIALDRFLIQGHRYRVAQKRGGGRVLTGVDWEALESRFTDEAATALPPDRAFDRRWAEIVLTRAEASLRAECGKGKSGKLFARLSPFLQGDVEYREYEIVAKELKMTPGAVSVAVHRLRRRYREILRAEVAATVASPELIEKELRHLVAAG